MREWKAALLGVPMFVKMMGIGLAMALFLGGGMFWKIHTRWQKDELGELEKQGQLLANHIAARSGPLLRMRNMTELQALLQMAVEDSPQVGFLEVRDEAGRVLAEAKPFGASAEVIEVSAPIPGEPGASVFVAMDKTHVTTELVWLTQRMIVAILLMTAFGMAGTWWVARLFTRPIEELVKSVRAVKAGDFAARAPVLTRDEAGELATAFNEMVATLQKKNALTHNLLHKLLIAEDEERKRVARELHDCTGQALASLVLGLSALRPGAHTERELSDLLEVATLTLSEVHDLSRALRPAALDDLGLAVALPNYCESCTKRLGVRITCETIGLSETCRLPEPMEVALYRIGQEAITNAVRHGHARSVDLVVHRKASSVMAVIEDDGEGFDAGDWRGECLRQHYLGLVGMEERAILLGGTLRVESRAGRGTSLFVEFPLEEAARG